MLLQQASATLGALETLLQFDCLEYDHKEQPFTTPHYISIWCFCSSLPCGFKSLFCILFPKALTNSYYKDRTME